MTQASPIRSELVDVNLIDIPADTRSHDPHEIDVLAESIGTEGQLQPIAVISKDNGRFDLIFGKGPELAARQIAQNQLKADIYKDLSEIQRLDMIFVEDEAREDTNPLYQAFLLKKMQEASGITQNQFA